mmetsp:Transcript_33809/g.73591  ORF Transcript_33809/g.73591 Transcript_33809/m.73591 type:complete len:315 (-) Transcript_33809:554-1498(-)
MPQELIELRECGCRHGQEGGACVHCCLASLVAELHPLAVHIKFLDVEQPVAELGVRYRAPRKFLPKVALGPTAKCDLAVLAGVLGQENGEGVGHGATPSTYRLSYDPEEVELRGLRETIQAQAKDAVELEALERLLGHFSGCDEPQGHATALVCGLRGVPWQSRRLSIAADAFDANNILNEDTRNLPRAKRDGDLVTRIVGFHFCAVIIDICSRAGGRAAEALVGTASFAPAIGAWEDKVAAARIEYHCEGLRRGADHQGAVIGASHEVSRLVPIDALPCQCHRQHLVARFWLWLRCQRQGRRDRHCRCPGHVA